LQSKILLVLVGISLLQTVQKENYKSQNSYLDSIRMYYKRTENAVAGVGRLNIPGANKSVAAEVRQVEIELHLLYDHIAQEQLLIV